MPRTPRPVSFTCSWCYKDVTEDRMPGPAPQYCQGCAVEAKRSAEAGRAKRYRARLHPRTGFERPRGRPRK